MISNNPLDRVLVLKAFKELDKELAKPVRLIVGGGSALLLAYDYPLATYDVDAFMAKGDVSAGELDQAAKRVAKKLGIPSDWLNSHFSTFTHVLPSDYSARLRPVFQGGLLSVEVLGPEDLLIMKFFSGRDKDRPHALVLIKKARNLEIVDNHLSELMEKRVPGAERAADAFDDLCDEVDL